MPFSLPDGSRLRGFRSVRSIAVLAALMITGGVIVSNTSTSAQDTECGFRGERVAAVAGESSLTDPQDLNAAFPGAGVDFAPSMGQFRLSVLPEYRPLMEGMPGYDSATGNLDSPVMFDRQTRIGRSDPLVNGSPEDAAGVDIGTLGITVSDSDFRVLPDPAVIPDIQGAREIHTAIQRFTLTGQVAGMTVATIRAGTDYPNLPVSPGEVRSSSGSGDPALDLPGTSFFNIYVEMDLPPNPTQPMAFTGATLHNVEPLLVMNDDVTDLPPRVVYIHDGPEAVAVMFKDSNPDAWSEGDVFGYLTLAGHGVCFNNTPDDRATLEAVLQSEDEIPTPVPPTPTPTDTPTPTETSTATPTATNTDTPTPEPDRLYLPLLLSEACAAPAQHMDVVLVLDTSSSMAGESIAAVRTGARAFLSTLRLGDGDQIAIVTFDAESRLALRLGADADLASRTVDALSVTGTGTGIDQGIERALEELQTGRHRPGNARLMVVMTDGQQSGGPDAALEAASTARSENVQLYTIGLGSNVDDVTLIAMSGSAERYLRSPSAAELTATFKDLSQALICPGAHFWPHG